MTIYYEKQRGDLCRLHALNAYYGFKKFSNLEFLKLCREYDEEIKGLKTYNGWIFGGTMYNKPKKLDKIDNIYVFLIL